MKPIHALCLMLAIVLAGNAFGQEDSNIVADYQASENHWRFIVSPYAMLANNATDVGGEKLRQSFNDLSSMTSFGFQLFTTVMYKNWVFAADGTYANLGSTSDSGVLHVDLDVKQFMMDLRLGYLVLTDIDLDDDSGVTRGWALEANAGAKYWQNDITLDYQIIAGPTPPLVQGDFEASQSWWDPMVGLKARIILSRTVLLGLSASGGGMGIGEASDYAWDVSYMNTFKVSSLLSVTAGYRSFKYKRADDGVETTVAVSGPVVGVSFVF